MLAFLRVSSIRFIEVLFDFGQPSEKHVLFNKSKQATVIARVVFHPVIH